VQECFFTVSMDTVHVGVDGSATAAGAAFRLSLFPEFAAEGAYDTATGSAVVTPKDLGTAPIVPSFVNNTHTVLKGDSIGTAEAKDSFYQVTVSPSTTYTISIPVMSDNVDLYVYGADSTFTTPLACPNTKAGGTTAETCVVTTDAGQTTLYLAVDGFFTKSGAAFMIQVVDASSVGEGSQDAPLSLGEQPLTHAGHLIAGNQAVYPPTLETTDSYYRVSVTPGLSYNVSLTGVTSETDLDLYVLSGKPQLDRSGRLLLDDLLCSSTYIADAADPSGFGIGTGDELGCTDDPTYGLAQSGSGPVAVPSGVRELFIFVDGGYAAPTVAQGLPVAFTLTVARPPPPTPEPPMTVGETRTGQSIDWAPDSGIGGPSDKYYSVPVTAGATYRVRIKNLTDDLDLYLFGADGTFSVALDCPDTFLGGIDPEDCEYTAPATPANGTLYFAVDGYWMSGYTATYDISVELEP
jgi:hypothetical protein